MNIIPLVEDATGAPLLESEHGLSLYIEANGQKILFDLGASDLFLKNAEKLEINLCEVDTVIISHGHYDHGGGLRSFLDINHHAKVYINDKAFDKHFSLKKSQSISDIGIDESLSTHPQIHFIDGTAQLPSGLFLTSKVSGSELLSSCNQTLMMEEQETLVPDRFEHEQYLIITEKDKKVLISGCAHRGIINIMKSIHEQFGGNLDAVFSGFHLYSYGTRTNEDPIVVAKIGEYLLSTQSKFYTGHCTGLVPYDQLKKIMGDQLGYMTAGTAVTI